jgi:alginate O-acetyltransferase complex protein AlgJ
MERKPQSPEGENRRSSIESIVGSLLSLAFVVVIGLPLIARIAGFSTSEKTAEKRMLSPQPAVPRTLNALRQFPAAFELYWNDQFPSRAFFVRLHSWLNVFALRTSPSSEILLGRDQWLFYTGNDNLEELRGQLTWTESQLRTFARRLQERERFVEELGGRYLLVFVPGKQSVYASMLPRWARKRAAETRLDQLCSYLEANTDLDYINLSKPLAPSPGGEPTFFRTDTHWTEEGAMRAYQSMMRRIQDWYPGTRMFDAEEMNWSDPIPYSGDLAKMIMLESELKDWRTPVTVEGEKNLTRRELGTGHHDVIGRGVFREVDGADPEAPSLFVFHDSYMGFQYGYMPMTFSQSWWKWQPNFDCRAIANRRPDIVLHEMAERFMIEGLAENPPEISAEYAALKDAYDRSDAAILELSPSSGFDAVTVGQQAEIESDVEGLAVHASGRDPTLFLPKIELPVGSRPVVRISLTSPVATTFRLYYWEKGNNQLFESSRYIGIGKNDIFLPLETIILNGRIRLDPGEIVGTYVLHRIDVKLVEMPAE